MALGDKFAQALKVPEFTPREAGEAPGLKRNAAVVLRHTGTGDDVDS